MNELERIDEDNNTAVKALIEKCEKTKCKNCKVKKNNSCPLGDQLIKYNKNQVCPVPVLQAKSLVYGIEVMDENVLLKRIQVNIANMVEWSTSPSHLKSIHDMLLSIKHEFFPSVQKSLNINVDYKQQILEWYDEVESETTSTSEISRTKK